MYNMDNMNLINLFESKTGSDGLNEDILLTLIEKKAYP